MTRLPSSIPNLRRRRAGMTTAPRLPTLLVSTAGDCWLGIEFPFIAFARLSDYRVLKLNLHHGELFVKSEMEMVAKEGIGTSLLAACGSACRCGGIYRAVCSGVRPVRWTKRGRECKLSKNSQVAHTNPTSSC